MSFDPNNPFNDDQRPGQFPEAPSTRIEQAPETQSTRNIGTFGLNLASGEVRGLPEAPKFDAQQAIVSIGEATGIDTEGIAKSTLGEAAQTISEIPGVIGDIPVVGDVAKVAAGVTGFVGGQVLEKGMAALGFFSWPLIAMQDLVYENAVTKERIRRYKEGLNDPAAAIGPLGYGSGLGPLAFQNELYGKVSAAYGGGKEMQKALPWPLSLIPDFGALNPQDTSYLSNEVRQMIDQGVSDDEILSYMRENMQLLTDDMYQGLVISIIDPLPGQEARLLGKGWRGLQAVADAVRWSEDAGQFAERLAVRGLSGTRLALAKRMRIPGKLYNMGSSLISRGYAMVTPSHFNAIADTVGEKNLSAADDIARSVGDDLQVQFVDNLVMDARYQYTVAAKEPTTRIASETAQAFSKKIIVTAANEGIVGLRNLQGFRGYSDEFYQKFVDLAESWKKLPDAEQAKALDLAMDELRLAYNQRVLTDETMKFVSSPNQLQIILRNFGNEVRARVKTVLDISKMKNLKDVSEHLSAGRGASGELFEKTVKKFAASISTKEKAADLAKVRSGLARLFSEAQESYNAAGGQQEAMDKLAGLLEIVRMSSHGKAVALLAPLKKASGKTSGMELLTIVRDDRFTEATLASAISDLRKAIEADNAEEIVKVAEALVGNYTDLGARFGSTIFNTLLKESPKEKASEVLDFMRELRENKSYVSRVSSALEKQLDLLEYGPGEGYRLAAQISDKVVPLDNLIYGDMSVDLENSDIISVSQNPEYSAKFFGEYKPIFAGELTPEQWVEKVYGDAPAWQRNLWNHSDNELDAGLHLAKVSDSLLKNPIDPGNRVLAEAQHQGLNSLPNILKTSSNTPLDYAGLTPVSDSLFVQLKDPNIASIEGPISLNAMVEPGIDEAASPAFATVFDEFGNKEKYAKIEFFDEWYMEWQDQVLEELSDNSWVRDAGITINGWHWNDGGELTLRAVASQSEGGAMGMIFKNRVMRLSQYYAGSQPRGVWLHPKIKVTISNPNKIAGIETYEQADGAANYQQFIVAQSNHRDEVMGAFDGTYNPVTRVAMGVVSEVDKLSPENARRLLLDPEWLVGRYLSGTDDKVVDLSNVILHFDKDGYVVRAVQLMDSKNAFKGFDGNVVGFDKWLMNFLDGSIVATGEGTQQTVKIWKKLGYDNLETAKADTLQMLTNPSSGFRSRALRSMYSTLKSMKFDGKNIPSASGMYASMADMLHSLDSVRFFPMKLTGLQGGVVDVAPKLSDYFGGGDMLDNWSMFLLRDLEKRIVEGDESLLAYVANYFNEDVDNISAMGLDEIQNFIAGERDPLELLAFLKDWNAKYKTLVVGNKTTAQNIASYGMAFNTNSAFHKVVESEGAGFDARLIKGIDSLNGGVSGEIVPDAGQFADFATSEMGQLVKGKLATAATEDAIDYGNVPNPFVLGNPGDFLIASKDGADLAKAAPWQLHGVTHRVYDPAGNLLNAPRIVDNRKVTQIAGILDYDGRYLSGAIEGRRIRAIKNNLSNTSPGSMAAKAALAAEQAQKEYDELAKNEKLSQLSDVRAKLRDMGYVLGQEPEEGFLRTYGIVYDVAGNPVTRPALSLYTKINQLLPAEALGLDKPELIRQANSARAKIVKMLTPVGNNELYDRAVQRLRVATGGALSETDAYRTMALLVKEGVEQEISIGGLTKDQVNAIFVRGLGGGEKGNKAFRRIFGPGQGGESARKVILFAISGDLSKIGATTKFSRTIQANYPSLATLANKLYPLARYRYNPYFNAQEFVEPYALTLLRGIHGSQYRRNATDLAAVLTTPGSFRYDSHELGSHILRYNSSVLDEIQKANPLVADAVDSRAKQLLGTTVSYLLPTGEAARRRTADIKVAATDWTTYNEAIRNSGRRLMREMPDVARAAMEVLGTTDPYKIFKHLMDGGINGTNAEAIIRLGDAISAPFTFGTAFDFKPMERVVEILSKPDISIDDLERLEDAHILVSKTGASTATQKEVATALDEVISSVRAVDANAAPIAVAGEFKGTAALTTADGLTQEIKNAVQTWVGGSYSSITRYLVARADTPIPGGIQVPRARDEAGMIEFAKRLGMYDSNATGDDRFRRIDELISRLDTGVQSNTVVTTSPIYRGADFEDIFAAGYIPKAGDEFRMLNMPSFTRVRSSKFAGNLTLRIENPIGMKGLDLLSESGLSRLANENEVLMARNQLWRIVSAAKNDAGGWEVVIDTVAPRNFSRVAGKSTIGVSYEAQGRLVRAVNTLRIEEEGRYRSSTLLYRLMETYPILKEYLKRRGIDLGETFEEVQRAPIIKRRSFALSSRGGDLLPITPERPRVAPIVPKPAEYPVVKPADEVFVSKVDKSTIEPGMNFSGDKSGEWVAADGTTRYWVKRPSIGSDRAKTEVARDLHVLNEYMIGEIYRRAGIKAPNTSILIDSDGFYIGSEIIRGKHLPENGGGITAEQANNFLDNLLYDLWLANFDVANSNFKNVIVDEAGDIVRLDFGSTGLYRAGGGLRADKSGMSKLVNLVDFSYWPMKGGPGKPEYGVHFMLKLAEGEMMKTTRSMLNMNRFLSMADELITFARNNPNGGVRPMIQSIADEMWAGIGSSGRVSKSDFDKFVEDNIALFEDRLKQIEEAASLKRAEVSAKIKAIEEAEAIKRGTMVEGAAREVIQPSIQRDAVIEKFATKLAYQQQNGKQIPLLNEILMKIEKGESISAKEIEVLGNGMAVSLYQNAHQEVLMNWAKLAWAEAANVASREQFYSMYKSPLERTLNHPFLGLYPTSYMWGKILPAFFNAMYKYAPFEGSFAPFLGAFQTTRISDHITAALETSPELQQYVASRPPLLFFLNGLLPGFPTDISVSLPYWFRNGIMRPIAEGDLEQIPGALASSAFETGRRSIGWLAGPELAVKAITDIQNFLTGDPATSVLDNIGDFLRPD